MIIHISYIAYSYIWDIYGDTYGDIYVYIQIPYCIYTICTIFRDIWLIPIALGYLCATYIYMIQYTCKYAIVAKLCICTCHLRVYIYIHIYLPCMTKSVYS